MNSNALIRLAAASILIIAASPIIAAEPSDAAALFPPGTLAYAELTNPAELSPQIAAVFKGTSLEDSIPLIHKQKDGAKTLMDLNGQRELAALGLLASPEMMSEFKRLRGVAIGLIGFTQNGEPEVALVVLTGDSPAAGLAARALITMSPTLRKVGEVSKVPVFQYRAPNINYDMMGQPVLANDKPLEESPYDWTFAYAPGLFVVGTSKTAIGHAIKRFVGEEKTGLAGTLLFKEAAAVHRQTGLFYFVNFPEFTGKFDRAYKLKGGMSEPDAYAWFKMIANARAIKSVAGNLHFRDGGLAATVAVSFDQTKKSPLVEFLSGPGAKVELLHYAHRPAILAVGVTLPEKNRAATAIGLLDAIAKANGVLGRLPSDVVKELQEKNKGAIVEQLLVKTRAITIVEPTKQELPKDTKSFPMLILHTEDATDASAWEDLIPKLIAEVSGSTTVPPVSSETIHSMKVFTLPGNGLPWNGPIHYSRNGKTIAIGLDRKLVASAVTPDANTAVTGGNKLVQPATSDSVMLLGVISLAETIPLLLEKTRSNGPVTPLEDGTSSLGRSAPVSDDLNAELKKSRTDFLSALGTLPPAILTAHRKENELRFELFQPKIQGGGLKTIVDTGAAWLNKWGGMTSGPRQFMYEGRAIYGKW